MYMYMYHRSGLCCVCMFVMEWQGLACDHTQSLAGPARECLMLCLCQSDVVNVVSTYCPAYCIMRVVQGHGGVIGSIGVWLRHVALSR